MAKNGNEAEEATGDVQMPIAVLGEQTLAVDLARAEIDQAIATAHRYPRNLDTVIKKIETMACYNEAASENCIYSLPRGGKPIIGPSIGFANVVAQAWGNCTDAARIVYIDRKEKVVVAEGGFHDLETNRKTVLPVQRRIQDKQGRLFNDDMIMVTGMAAASIARRNAILNAVPRALWFPIYERALLIVRGDVETFAERKDKALKAFGQFGVKPEQVFMALGLKGDADMTLEHIAPMRGMYSALRDGSTTVEEMFDPRRMTGTGFETVPNPLGDEGDSAPAPKETIDKETGEIKAAPVNAAGVSSGSGGASSRGPTAQPTGGSGAPAYDNSPKEKKTKSGRPKKEEKPQPEPEPATPDPMEAKQPPKETPQTPRTPEEYKVYMTQWLAACKTASLVEDQWRLDRELRGRCMVTEDLFLEVQAAKNARIAELQPK